MKIVKLFALAAVLAAAPACKKKPKQDQQTTEPAGSGSGSAAEPSAGSGSAEPAGSGSGSAAADPAAGSGSGSAAVDPAAAGSGSSASATPDASADWIKVYGTHTKAQPTDPVEVSVPYKITKANFDPKKIEGGTATLELDLANIETSDPKRTGHLKSPDYIDAAKFATATVDISNVKKKDDKNFTADAKVKLHGVEKKFPVAFEIVEATDDAIKVKGEHKFQRLDFKVGKAINEKDPDKGDGVAPELTVKLQLTLRKTS